METIFERVAGLDVHKAQVTACVRVPGPGGEREEHLAEFQTTVRGLVALRDWLEAHRVTHVAMEATGVYWQPVWHVLEDTAELLLVNARHVKQVPGRKTDVSDAAWIGRLLEAGLLRGSFVPPKPQRAMLDALVRGTTDPEVLSELARGRLRQKLPALREALEGRFQPHHALVIGAILSHLDFLDEHIDRLSDAIEEQLGPFAQAVGLACTIPGVARRTAEVLLAEVGTDMSRFPSAGHLASWAGRCPGNHQSAGKRRSGRSRKGSKWLGIALEEAALAATRAKGTYLQAQYQKPQAPAGPQGGVVSGGSPEPSSRLGERLLHGHRLDHS